MRHGGTSSAASAFHPEVHPWKFDARMSATASPAGVSRAPGNEDAWVITDADLPPATMTTGQILAMIGQGRVGLASQVRRASEAQWTRTADRPEFAYAFPQMRFTPGAKGKTPPVLGFTALNSNPSRALDLSRILAADPQARTLGFWFSAHLDWIPAPIVRRSRLFPLWGGFWVAPIVESSVVKPDGWLNVYLAAFNLTKRQQEHSLRATDAEIPEGMRGNLSFSLHPGRWAVQLVSVPTNRGAGEHSVSFKTRSGAERAATAVAVGVLTLGSFIYAPGSSGFSLRYTVLTPETAQNVTQWEGYAMQAADRRFKEAGANAIDDGKGGRISQATVLQQFRAYLTPSLLLAALRSKRAAPEVVITSLLDEFLFDAFGIKGSQNAFVAG